MRLFKKEVKELTEEQMEQKKQRNKKVKKVTIIVAGTTVVVGLSGLAGYVLASNSIAKELVKASKFGEEEAEKFREEAKKMLGQEDQDVKEKREKFIKTLTEPLYKKSLIKTKEVKEATKVVASKKEVLKKLDEIKEIKELGLSKYMKEAVAMMASTSPDDEKGNIAWVDKYTAPDSQFVTEDDYVMVSEICDLLKKNKVID